MSPRRQAPGLRQCLACRGWELAAVMVRWARHADGSWHVGPGAGRGHYLHRNEACLRWIEVPRNLQRLAGQEGAARLRTALKAESSSGSAGGEEGSG